MATLVAFDLDGTLVDSRQDIADSTNELLAAYGADPLPAEEVGGMVGDGAGHLVRRALHRRNVTGPDVSVERAIERFLAIYERRLVVHTRPYPGIVDLLRWTAPRAAVAVLTNKPEALTRRLLDALELAPHIAHVIGGDSGVPRKPDPAGLVRLMALAESLRETSLMVGDSMVDVETARRAGVPMCVALYGFGQLRGPLALAPDEFPAADPGALAAYVIAFVDRLGAADARGH